MTKPVRINVNPVAAKYAATDERIIEYSSLHGGGLISFRSTEDGRLRIDLYRHDTTVDIIVGDKP